MDTSFWSGRPVFVTGHTGFKGAWLCVLLDALGAQVHGYALDTPEHYLYNRAGLGSLVATDQRADIRDTAVLREAIAASGAQVVLHLAAQTVVRESYDDPHEAFSSNVMGTFSVLQACRDVPGVTRCVVVTTDKVYFNNEWVWGYRETDRLGGDDPYSASKAAAEIVAHSMAVSFPREGYAVATARAGNVVGGGDATPEALMPELVGAYASGRQAVLRRPAAVRPWQHVLEPLSGYLTLAEHLTPDRHATAWNFGPATDDALTVGEVATRLATAWGDNASWCSDEHQGPHEAGLLMLDSARARTDLAWSPAWDVTTALSKVVTWEQSVRSGTTPLDATRTQVAEYLTPPPA
ncbi:MAG: CDP-glucose 4,6-dehydratase [Micrococcales bacterium]|nr:CDP-glucose 4,6-dehydratase [Micrococcales bacterium]MCL2667094.1 CDP-glucose 4,6-dehydratase [Micrococcales bacterium]